MGNKTRRKRVIISDLLTQIIFTNNTIFSQESNAVDGQSLEKLNVIVLALSRRTRGTAGCIEFPLALSRTVVRAIELVFARKRMP